MPPPPRPLLVLALAAAFATAHTQGPLFFSNQNQYLLQGLAAAGYGHLSADWLSTTADPTPLFSAGIAAAYRVAGLWPLQAGYFLLLTGYFVAAYWLVSRVWSVPRGPGVSAWLPPPLRGRVGEGGLAPHQEDRQNPEQGGPEGTPPSSPHPNPLPQGGREPNQKPSNSSEVTPLSATRLLVWAALFTAAHAAVFRVLSVALTGVDYPWNFQAGVAGQYLLGPGLQPSAFGVLLLASVAAFAADRPLLAGALAGAAGLIHATYLLPGALLVVGYLAKLTAEKRTRAAVGAGAVALLAALPAVGYAGVTFAPAEADGFAEAQRILAEIRIPHHAVVARWFDAVAALQLGWVGLGLLALRGTRLLLPLAIAAVGGTLLTLVVTVFPHPSLALLFPWRVSALLVPVATAVLAARAAARLPAGQWVAGVAVAGLAGMVAAGVWVMAARVGYAMNTAEVPLLEYVRGHAGPGDVVLIPTRVPAVGAGRGSISTSFTPPPRPRPGSNLIPVDLQRFRLATGAPIYVDFKSVPYADAEVLEWYRRVRQVEEWYAAADWDAAVVRDGLKQEGITLVVAPRDKPPKASFLDLVYADEAYHLYRVK